MEAQLKLKLYSSIQAHWVAKKGREGLIDQKIALQATNELGPNRDTNQTRPLTSSKPHLIKTVPRNFLFGCRSKLKYWRLASKGENKNATRFRWLMCTFQRELHAFFGVRVTDDCRVPRNALAKHSFAHLSGRESEHVDLGKNRNANSAWAKKKYIIVIYQKTADTILLFPLSNALFIFWLVYTRSVRDIKIIRWAKVSSCLHQIIKCTHFHVYKKIRPKLQFSWKESHVANLSNIARSIST